MFFWFVRLQEGICCNFWHFFWIWPIFLNNSFGYLGHFARNPLLNQELSAKVAPNKYLGECWNFTVHQFLFSKKRRRVKKANIVCIFEWFCMYVCMYVCIYSYTIYNIDMCDNNRNGPIDEMTTSPWITCIWLGKLIDCPSRSWPPMKSTPFFPL